MVYQTFADAETLRAAKVNEVLMGQRVIQCTSTTRPPGVDGRVIYETDRDTFWLYKNGGWTVLLGREFTVAISLGNGWVPYDAAGTGFAQPLILRSRLGTVKFYGLIKNGTIGSATPFAVLGADLRPAENRIFMCPNNNSTGVARVNVDSNGNCYVATFADSPTAANGWLDLSAIEYHLPDGVL
ncbi:MAG: hypothetical protein ACOYY2_13010 [Actinomycetota bacterium]